MRYLTTVAALAAALALAACGSSSPQASRPTAAQCARAKAAVHQITLTTSPFTGVTSTDSLFSADMQVVGDSAATGSAQSDLATLSAAALAVAGPLSRDLRLVAADYRAFEAASTTTPASPQAVASAAQATMHDVHAIEAVCVGS